jgi:phenylacetate-CoA ligase
VLPVHVELAAQAADTPDLAPRIEAEFKKRLGATIRITVQPHGTFPRTEGKTKRVIRSYE